MLAIERKWYRTRRYLRRMDRIHGTYREFVFLAGDFGKRLVDQYLKDHPKK